MMSSATKVILERLANMPCVIGAGVFDDEGDEVAFYGVDAARAAAQSCADVSAALATDGEMETRIGTFDGGGLIAHPISGGLLVLVGDFELDTSDGVLWFHIESAVRDLNVDFYLLDVGTPHAAGFFAHDDTPPLSETSPCFARPPGF